MHLAPVVEFGCFFFFRLLYDIFIFMKLCRNFLDTRMGDRNTFGNMN